MEMATETHPERKVRTPDWQGIRSIDMLGFSPAYGLTRMDAIVQDEDPSLQHRELHQAPAAAAAQQRSQQQQQPHAQFVKITVENPRRTKRNASYTYGEKLDFEKDDNLSLCGKTAFLNTAAADLSAHGRKSAASRATNSSLPSIHKMTSDGSSVVSTSSVHVTPYYDTDFGFHFERLGPTAGMSLHKDPPQDTRDFTEELANTAEKHIYSLQIVSTHHRGCKRSESVHSLLNTIWPTNMQHARSSRARARTREKKTVKTPAARGGQQTPNNVHPPPTGELPPRSGQRSFHNRSVPPTPIKPAKRINSKLSRANTNQFDSSSLNLAAGVCQRSIKLESRSFLPDIEATISGNTIYPTYKNK